MMGDIEMACPPVGRVSLMSYSWIPSCVTIKSFNPEFEILFQHSQTNYQLAVISPHIYQENKHSASSNQVLFS